MMRALLNRWAARRLSAVAHQRRVSDRDAVRAKARQLCEEMGRPIPPSLR